MMDSSVPGLSYPNGERGPNSAETPVRTTITFGSLRSSANDARRDASHADQIARFRLNLDAGSGLTGLAKMAVIRGDEVKVLTALGPTNRMLDRE